MKVGAYNPPQGSLLEPGEHLVSIVEVKSRDKDGNAIKSKQGNRQIEIRHGHGEGSPCCEMNGFITDFTALVDNQAFKLQQLMAAQGGKKPDDLTEVQWQAQFKPYGEMDTESDVDKLAKDLATGKNSKNPYWITVGTRIYNGAPQVQLMFPLRELGIKACTNGDKEAFVKWEAAAASNDGIQASNEPEDDPSPL